MKEYRIQADAGKELAISRWPDGKYSIKVFSSLGQMVAQLVVSWDEGSRLRTAMLALSDDCPASPSVSPSPEYCDEADCEECTISQS